MRTYRGHTDFVEAIAFHPNRDRLASGSADGTARLWDVVSGECVRVLEAEGKSKVGAVAFSPYGLLMTGDYGGRVYLYEPGSRVLGGRVWEGLGRIVGVGFLASPWGVWASYHEAARMNLNSTRSEERHRLATGSPKPYSLAVLPAAGLVAVGRQSAEVALYGVRDAEEHVLTHGQSLGCWSLAFSPDGHTLALALAKGAQLWDVAAQRLLTSLDGHSDVVSGIAYSPSGDRLATCSFDGTVRLYRVTAGRSPSLIESYDWKLGRLFCVAFSPDGTLAAVGGETGDFLLAWDVE